MEAYGKAASAGHTEQAEAAAFQLLSLATHEAEHNPSPELLLLEQARLCEERGAWEEAVRTVEPGPLYDASRAGAWVARARCRVLAGDDELAEQDLIASQ